MTCTSPKQIWDVLRDEFVGTEKTKKQTLLNLRREFENLKIGDDESVKSYADKMTEMVNNIRFYGDVTYPESRVVEKMVNILPEKYEFTISSFENGSRDITTITLAKLLNALFALKQMRSNRQKSKVKGAMFAKKEKGKKKMQSNKKKEVKKPDANNKEADRKKFPPCTHCKKDNHQEKFCWRRPDIVSKYCNKKGHDERIFRNRKQAEEQNNQAQNHVKDDDKE